MENNNDDVYEEYSSIEDFSGAITFMEEIIKGIEEGAGLKLIRAEDLETVYDELDIARSLNKAIQLLRRE